MMEVHGPDYGLRISGPRRKCIRIAWARADGELYILSKSDGVVRAVVGATSK